jgi:UDP-2-acetamido-2,6-beta-L-arabino-hexul-4-ose reductase
MKVGITGWRGFIGSKLKDKIENPILFDGDLRDLSKVKLFVKECDRIYHVAGLNRDKEGKILANNIISTGNLILASKMVQKDIDLIFLSSKQIYWNANSEYGTTKQIEESIAKMACRWCIYRIPNVYGTGCKPFYNSVVATFAYQLSHNQKVTVKDSNVTREFVYVDDLINELLKPSFQNVIDVRGEVLTIGEIYGYLTNQLGQHEKLYKCMEYYKNKEIEHVS